MYTTIIHMKFKKPYSAKKSYKSKKPTVKKAIKKVADKIFEKKVLKVVEKRTETKQAFLAETSHTLKNTINVANDVMQIIPAINQGTSDNTRIGDQINLQKITIKGYFRLPLQVNTPNQAYNRRIALRCMIVKPKKFNSLDDIKTNYPAQWLPYLLKKGGTTTGFTGAISDLWAPVNTDVITKYYDKIFYLKEDQIYYGGATLTNGIPVAISSEGTVKFFSITKTFKKSLKYDTGMDSALLPTNFSPVLVCGLVYLNGDAPTGTTEAYVSFDTVMDYEDA